MDETLPNEEHGEYIKRENKHNERVVPPSLPSENKGANVDDDYPHPQIARKIEGTQRLLTIWAVEAPHANLFRQEPHRAERTEMKRRGTH